MRPGGLLLATSLACLAIGSVSAGTAYPLVASTNGRYLVDQSGVPFLLVGDSPQALMVNTISLNTRRSTIPLRIIITIDRCRPTRPSIPYAE